MIELAPLDSLRPHEKTRPARLRQVVRMLVREGRVRKPILVDKKTGVILDGHHRFAALRRLGYTVAPIKRIDYDSNHVRVRSRRKKIPVDKHEVRRRGLSGELFPPKTTRHQTKVDEVPVALGILRHPPSGI